MKRKVEDIDNFDCLKIKTTPGSAEETMKKYVVLGMRELIKVADGTKIRRFLTEFTPYIRNMNYTKKAELMEIVKGYLNDEFTTYEDYLKSKETVQQENEPVNIESFLNGSGTDSEFDEDEGFEVGVKDKKDSIVKSDVSLYTKKVNASMKDAISYMNHVKTLQKSGKIALVMPKKEELDSLETNLKDLLKTIEELKNN